ncbi:MAG TPA: hypothetical protein VF981_10515, partial [Gemmatimonadaceae bacterium]
WKEIHAGASIQIPPIFKFIMKYVAPAYLIIVFVGFCVQNLSASIQASWASTGSRMGILTIAGTLALLVAVVKAGDKRWRAQVMATDDAQAAD